MKLQTLFAVVAVFVGCADHPYDPDAPAIDPNAPHVHIVSPARGTIAGDVSHVLVSGTASDDSGAVASVTVNGVQAVLADDGTWMADVPVTPGTSLLHAIASDAQGNLGAETRAVVAGPMVSLDRHITDAIHATVSAQALASLGRGTATFIESGGLETAVERMNPVADVGGGPDCLYGQARVTSLTVGDADVLMGPTTGGVLVSAVLTNLRIGMHLQWAVTCLNGSTDIVITAQRVTVQGSLAIGVVDRKLDVHFNNPDVQVSGLDLQLPGVPDAVVQMLALDSTIGPVLGAATAQLVVPVASEALSVLDDTRTIDVAGVQVDLDVEPTRIDFTSEGGTIALDTSLRARGDHGDFVFVPTGAPALDMTNGFELAVADDAANQLLTSMWSAKAFDKTMYLESGAYGQIGKLYDSAQLQLAVPPYLDATGDRLVLTMGDWIATFEIGGERVPASVAIHATTDLYVVKGDDGKLRIDLGTPTVDLDVAADANPLTKEQYDAVRSFAIERIKAVGSAAIAALPLPAIGDAMPTNLWIEPEAGYLLIAGDVK